MQAMGSCVPGGANGRKLRFKVEAQDEGMKVGEGTHRRAIIAVQRAGCLTSRDGRGA